MKEKTREQQYRKNHTVASFQINFWKVKVNGKEGVHVYDLRTRKPQFSENKSRQKPYAFTIENDFYTWDRGAERDPRLETWFSGIETELRSLIERMQRRDTGFLRPAPIRGADGRPLDLLQLFDIMQNPGLRPASEKKPKPPPMMVLASQKTRSRYVMQRILDSLKADPELLDRVSGGSGQSPEEIVRTNVPLYAGEVSTSLMPTEIQVLHATEGSFILTDRPTAIQPGGERLGVMTPKIAVRYRKAASTSVSHRNLDPDGVFEVNAEMALFARDWVVATDPALLEKIIPIFDSDSYKAVVDSEDIELVKPVFFKTGYRY